MATMLAPEEYEAPNASLALGADALADMGLVSPPPVGTKYKLKGEAEVTAVNADGGITLAFEELKLMHELEAEDKASMMYPSMKG
jgi:hypothetical protein